MDRSFSFGMERSTLSFYELIIMSKKKFKKEKEKRDKKERGTMFGSLLQLMQENPGKSFKVDTLIRKLGLKKKALIEELFKLLDHLEADGELQQNAEGGYRFSKDSKVARTATDGTVTGIVDHVNARFAYIATGIEGAKDIYVKTPDLNTAMHGDTVNVKVSTKSAGASPEGRVTEVVKRARNRFVGKIEISKNYAFVVPDFKKVYQDFFIYNENINGAKANDKVLFEVTRWGDGDRSPEGKVIEILGKSGENNAEIHSIMAEFDLPFRFPENVLKESEQISEKISRDEIKKRRDFREILTFTIDPEDAKDFDDAISFRELEGGYYEVGVHIADVTHYVNTGTVLDEDAFDRATSVYLVDRTVPMLPERLSNGLCSLRPHEDKLTFAAVFEMDKNGKIRNEWFGRTIIHSAHRFSYEQAQEGIETGKGPYAAELKLLNDIAIRIRKDRFKNGAVNFESAEVKFKLDESGKPLAVIPKIRKDAHKLIEEYMLLANKAVATYVYKMKKGEEKNTFVYRIHDSPDPEKLEDFSKFARQFGHKVDLQGNNVSRSLNGLMDDIEGKPEQNVLQSLAVRAMAKAKYSTEAKGHFGLAFPHYSHFTSPIRRYPDMMVHRLLQHYLDGGKSANKKDYEDKCVHSSEREKRAAEAERASIKYKQVEFMSMAENKMYEGIITGVTDFGLFIEITETKCEGMVRLADMKDDYYDFDEKNYRIVGQKKKKIYRLGDKVEVRIKKTDVDKRTIDLTFETEPVKEDF
jgi:ribonuclease R